mmetsp:Transcript_12626/g.15279  ORF Transcript_12626/g.15279 Transcript_12626/m.15279 type:complete len:162 (+) Transcript_12626:192-677(+)|eukprot:CAMPEP_0184043388 /NCGR_PEP_ID=MMETSP0955-20130417/66895_1 /TAXON_ID=627963 /ORGANISM="Aplanochytrium sp, Strain PBS07" /LENGTH=161 /DNA_ID=CAMNT_0026334295 /DNA_START=91 /DNA_END=576 /DNA_ORIENTATION=+
MSGIHATQEALEEFNSFKMQNSRKGTKYSYIVYRIIDEKVVITKKQERVEDMDIEDQWEDFCQSLNFPVDSEGKEDENGTRGGAYGTFDFTTKVEGLTISKGIFVTWAPGDVSVRQRLLIGATAESFRAELGSASFHHVVQAGNFENLDINHIYKKFKIRK